MRQTLELLAFWWLWALLDYFVSEELDHVRLCVVEGGVKDALCHLMVTDRGGGGGCWLPPRTPSHSFVPEPRFGCKKGLVLVIAVYIISNVGGWEDYLFSRVCLSLPRGCWFCDPLRSLWPWVGEPPDLDGQMGACSPGRQERRMTAADATASPLPQPSHGPQNLDHPIRTQVWPLTTNQHF